MINCVIAAKLMLLAVNPMSAPPTAIGYAFAAHQLAIKYHDAHHSVGAIINDKTSNMLEYRHLVKKESTRALWETSFANKIRRLFQGIRHLKGTNTCFFICKEQVLLYKRPTYSCICCNFRPQKEEQHHTCLTVGSNCTDYPGNKATPTVNLTTAKLLINSTISMPGGIFLGIDLANFYLNTPMPNPKYMRLQLIIIPDGIIVTYKLRELGMSDGWRYIKICKGMYRLPQAGILANQLLERRLAAKRYYQCQHTPGLWQHMWQTITFCLVVNNVGIKVTNMLADFEHLKEALEEHYTVAVDYEGSLFCGVKLAWDYARCHVNCSMPGYIATALKKYQHVMPTVPQNAPCNAAAIQYSTKVQRVETNTSAPLSKRKIKHVQDIVGTLLYYARAINPTLLAALNAIAT
jgi:hypothetical protein